MKKYILKKSILSIAFIVFSFAFIALTFPVMKMNVFPTYLIIDLFYLLAIAVLTFALPLVFQWISQLILMIVEFAVLISSASLFISRGDVFTWPLIKQISQVKTVSDMVKIPVTQLIIGIVLILSFIAFVIFFRLKEKVKLKKFYHWLTMVILLSILTICSGGNVFIHIYINKNYDNLYYYSSDAYMYHSFISSYASLQKFGFYGYYAEDLCRRLFPSWKPEILNASDLFEYEHYTSILNGLCEDNNVVMIYAESFDIYGISKELTPVLYALKKGADLSENGISDYYNISKENNETTISRKDFNFNGTTYTFNNANIFDNTTYNEVGLELADYISYESTDFSEHKALTGCWNTYYGPSYAIPQMLEDYNSTYLHGNWGTFYDRIYRMKDPIGFDKTFFLEDMEDFAAGNKKFENGSINVCSLDSLTIKHYTDNNSEYNIFPADEKFLTFFMTVTTHGSYAYSEYLDENYAFVDAVASAYNSSDVFSLYNSLDEGLKNSVREYYARVLDTEYALAYLVNYLYENEILNKTIITFTGDHNAYSNNIHLYKEKYLEQVLNVDKNLYYTNVEGFIYSTQIKDSFLSENDESRVISHITESTDLVPTILTLLKRDYDQELFVGSAVINKSVKNPSETVYNKVARSYSRGLVENDYFQSYDGSTISSKIPEHKPTQEQIKEFKDNYNLVFVKYEFILEKRLNLFN